jgi:spore germination cell wall hydrolase CwlJ-like protein
MLLRRVFLLYKLYLHLIKSIYMNWFSLLALCASANNPVGIDCDSVRQSYKLELAALRLSSTDIDAIARTAYAEAANQGSAGLSGVVFTIMNRRISGQFPASIEAIVNSKNQFEPVTNAGGWYNLPVPTLSQLSKIETIIELAQSGYLPDPTHGALYFQNSEVVAERVESGTVSENLVHFGNSPISATIDDHTFYALMCQSPTNNKSDAVTPALRKLERPSSNGIKQLRGGSN